jgi:hypothetical protein
MNYLKTILLGFVLFNISANADENLGKEYYEEDCASSCHKPDPREGHVNLVILNRFDLRSQVQSCSQRFAPFWEWGERSAVVDYLYATFYKEQHAAEVIEDLENTLFDCEKNFPGKDPMNDD